MEKDKEVVQDLKLKDEIFMIYCKGVNEISDFQNNKPKRDAIEEKWALFLKQIDVEKLPAKKIK